MKKTLIALAAVAVSGAAFAQATISGTFNVDMQTSTSAKKATIGMGDAIVGVSVKEDLGGGMSVAASTTFQTKGGRGTEVSSNGYSFSLKGGFGGVTLKNYLNANNNLSAGISAEDDMNDVIGAYTFRTRLQYDLPKMIDGVHASLRWDTTEAATSLNTTSTGAKGAGAITTASGGSFSTTKFNVGYAAGPLSVDLYGDQDDAFGLVIAGYDAGVAKFGVAYQDVDAQTEATVVVPFGAMSAGVHVINSDTTEAYGFRVTYALSKRSNVSFNYVDASKGAKTGNNYRLRMSHSF
jgi:hypothetical protein